MNFVLSNFFNFLMPVSLVIDTSCNYYQELAKGQVYYIFNKEYPQNYSAGSTCQWTAKSPPNSKIFLSCDDVTMPSSANCINDRLEISSSDRKNLSELHSYCGEGSFSLITQKNTLEIVLKSTHKSSGGRFLCSVTAVKTQSENEQSFQMPVVQPSCQCGWKNEKRIVGGHDTGVNEYPAMAGLVDRNREMRVYCGASIISNRYVLTAAHCVQNRDFRGLFLLVGDHDVSTGTDTRFSVLYKVNGIKMWNGYNDQTYEGDIALVQVDKINFNENVGPICLPFRYSYNTFEGETVSALGWGQLEFSGNLSNILQEVDLQVISNLDCQESSSEVIASSELCTYAPEKDSCQSDSGGPIIWQNQANKRLFLLGIISHGIGCGAPTPGINTRVTSFLEWIRSKTGDYFCVM